MSQKPRVGQNSSNALRTYHREIGNVKTQCEKFKELGNVSGKPLRMAVVFTTRDGMIQCLGGQEWTNIIMDNCADQLIESLTNQETPESPSNARVGILRLPKPVSQLNSKTLQSIIPLAMKNLQGGGYIKWEQASAKPQWWPEDVVFANVKQRPAEQSGGELDIHW